MTAVPPSAVHSVSSPSSASSHILSKHTAAATTVTHTHPQLHLDRPSERHLPLDRGSERQAEMLMPLERQGPSSSSGSVAPPSGPTVSLRANSPTLPVQTSGTCSRNRFICEIAVDSATCHTFSLLKHVSGNVPATPKLTQLPVRTSQKVKATLANIPVGNYEGGGRGKERDREKEREAAGSGHFSFDTQSSPATHPMDELPPERAPESCGAADSSEPRSRDGATTKEVRGPSCGVTRAGLCRTRVRSCTKAACIDHFCRRDGRSASLRPLCSLHPPPQSPTCPRHTLIRKDLHPKSSRPAPLR